MESLLFKHIIGQKIYFDIQNNTITTPVRLFIGDEEVLLSEIRYKLSIIVRCFEVTPSDLLSSKSSPRFRSITFLKLEVLKTQAKFIIGVFSML